MSSLKDRIAATRANYAQRKAGFERAYKFKPGQTIIRLLPGVSDPDEFFREYGAHYIRDPNTDAMVAVVGDAQITFQRTDPVREAIGELMGRASRVNDQATYEKLKKWLAKPVTVVNAQIIKGDDENKGKVVRPEFSSTAFDSILIALQLCADTADGSDGELMKNGLGALIVVDRVGTGPTDTRYTFSAYPKQPSDPVPQAVLDQRLDLDEYINGKFGDSVVKALAALSNMLGRDVTQSALGQAMTQTAELAAPASSKDIGIHDLSVDVATEEAPFDAAPAAPAGKTDEVDSILAELDNL